VAQVVQARGIVSTAIDPAKLVAQAGKDAVRLLLAEW
jgi:adenine deaminase